MKKCICSAIVIILVVLSMPTVFAGEVDTSAQAYALYCADNGETLLSENAEAELPIASTTKIMTTLLTLEEAAKDNRTVTFTEEMSAEGSSMYLKRGEKVTLYDLAVGMMMQSGNDAANAAAIAIAGSFEAFAQRMNEKARAFGMTHTHFVTPSGLDDDEHYSCARDMALLMARAMENESFAYITSQTSMEVHFIYPADKFVTYPNHNKLLRMYDDCIGGKTGYTDTAGRCLVSAARRDGMTLIAVTLNDRDDWNDHIALYDYGFAQFRRITLCAGEAFAAVVGGEQDTIPLYADDACAVVPKASGEPEKQVILPPFLYAPVEKNAVVGQIFWTMDGKTIAQAPLRAEEAVAYNKRKRSFLNYIKDLLNWHS